MSGIEEVKERAAAELQSDNLDWGFCVPDCGCCCGRGQVLTQQHAERLAKTIGVEITELADPEPDNNFYRLKTVDKKCVMNYGPSLCLAHPDKPLQCQYFSDKCGKYSAMALLSRKTDIKNKIKDAWAAERSRPDYSQETWLKRAYNIILVALH